MKNVFISLSVKLGVAIFLIATVLLTGLGVYFSHNFNKQIDERLLTVAQIPGRLLNQQAIPYSTARDKEALSKLVGEKIILAILCRPDGTIYYSTDRQLEELNLTDATGLKIPAIDSDAREMQFDSCVAHNLNGELTVTVPIYAENRMLGQLYLKMETTNTDAQKLRIQLELIGGFLICIALITLLSALILRRMTVPRLQKILECIYSVQQGDFSVRVKRAKEQDEISNLASGVNHMVEQLELKSEEQRKSDQQLRRASAESDRANRCKSEFLANMSHEIRTPMNGVLGMAQLLQTTSLSNEQREYLSTIISAGENLLDLIDNILDLSRVEMGQMELSLKEINIAGLLTQLESLFMPGALKKGLKLKISSDSDLPRVWADDNHLRQVLINLVANAIKFTHEGSVWVRVKCNHRSDSECALNFSVRDTGIGISKKDQLLIFNEFTQADGSYSREFGGTGLGLSISRNIVENMGGELTVSSTLGKGSVFQFTLRLEIASETAPQQTTKALKTGQKDDLGLNVLVVEDNQVNQMVISKMLTTLGCQFDLAKNGQEALDKLNLNAPIETRPWYDIILMDIQMPVLDGAKTTAQLRKLEGAHRTPVIAITAHAMKGDRERFLESGINDYLAKPLQQDALRAILQKYTSP